jgi:tetratricopeptide (TPR) repeat protein
MNEQAQALYRTGMAEVKNGKTREAIASFEQALQLAPRDKVLLNAAGGACNLDGDFEKARTYYLESLKADPDFAPARQNLGVLLYSLGRFGEAETQFRIVAGRANQSQAVANLFLGLIAEKRSDCKTAVSLLGKAGRLLQQYPDALLAFAGCQSRLGDGPAALQVLEEFDSLPNKSAAQLGRAAEIRTGVMRDRPGRREGALEGREDSPSSRSLRVPSDEKRAELLEKAGKLDEAQALLENLADKQPTGDVLLDLARVAKERGDLAVAFKSLRRASQLEPDREDSYLEFSTICTDHDSDSLALKAAEIGLSHVPHSYRLTVQKGVLLAKLGRRREAAATLRVAATMQKDNSTALVCLAVVLSLNNDKDGAEHILADVIRRFPDNYYIYYLRGKFLQEFRTDSEESARGSFEEAVRLNPNHADSYYQLSRTYLTTSPQRAEQALEKCLKLDPNHLPAKFALARLYLQTGRKAEGQALLARFITQQQSEDLQQQKRLLIVAAPN